MKKSDQRGSATTAVVIILLVVALVAVGGFAGWAYNQRQDYKSHSDQKSAKAVTAAEAALKTKLQQQFAEAEKKPYTTYKGPITFGSVSFEYPKTWSAYVDEASSGQPINGYFHPDKVPGLQSKTPYALRLELVNTDYAQLLQQYEAKIKSGEVKAAAYIPPKMVNVANVQPGTRLDGNISVNNKQGTLVAIKVRDKTLQIYTESQDFLADFNNVILPSLTFSP